MNLEKMNNYLLYLTVIISSICQLVFFSFRDNTSELLVLTHLEVNGNLRDTWPGLFFYDGQPYTSQIGAHRYILDIYFKIFKPSTNSILFLIISNTIFCSFVITRIQKELSKYLNFWNSILFVLPIISSPFFLLNSGNLYWIYALYFLPFLYSLKYYGEIKNILFYLLLFSVILLKMLFGFEYISTIMSSALLGILMKINFLGQKINFKSFVYTGFKTTITAVVAFCVSLAFLSINISSYDEEKDNIIEVIESYAIASDNSAHFKDYKLDINTRQELYEHLNTEGVIDENNGWDNVIQNRNNYKGLSSLLQYFELSSIRGSFYTLILLFFILILFYNSIRINNDRQYLFFAWFGFLSSLTWILLMPLHFYLHSIVWKGISNIVLVFPFFSTVTLLINLKHEKS